MFDKHVIAVSDEERLEASVKCADYLGGVWATTKAEELVFRRIR